MSLPVPRSIGLGRIHKAQTTTLHADRGFHTKEVLPSCRLLFFHGTCGLLTKELLTFSKAEPGSCLYYRLMVLPLLAVNMHAPEPFQVRCRGHSEGLLVFNPSTSLSKGEDSKNGHRPAKIRWTECVSSTSHTQFRMGCPRHWGPTRLLPTLPGLTLF